MTEKLMTLRELSEYLRVPEDRLAKLVEDRVIPAYRIGGELLRFRKEQIDAMKREIDAHVGGFPRHKLPTSAQSSSKKSARSGIECRNNFSETVSDFFYFNDFYILSAAIAGILLAVILMG